MGQFLSGLHCNYMFLHQKLKEKNPRQGGASLEKVYEEIEKPIISVVKKMEDFGILIDKKYFEKLSLEYQRIFCTLLGNYSASIRVKDM